MNYFNKAYWWDNNLAWLRRQQGLWSDGKLGYIYREMVGDSGREMYARMEKLLPDPSYFGAVDDDPVCLLRHALAAAPFTLIHGDFYLSAIKALKAQRERPGPRIGVLNFDTMDAASRAWWTKHRQTLRQIVDLGVAGCPAFTMILNHVLNMGSSEIGDHVADRIGQHGQEIVRTFEQWIPARLTHLFTDVGERYDHSKLPTRIGAYDIYRSKDSSGKDNVAVMITVRLTFRKDYGRALFDQAA